MKGLLLLLTGPPGAGKSTLIRRLGELDPSFKYVRPFTTRPLRPDETDKVFVSDDQLLALHERGDLLALNELYGFKYGTPKTIINDFVTSGMVALLDWPIQKAVELKEKVQCRVCVIYIAPPDVVDLRKRLFDRDRDEGRVTVAEDEMARFNSGAFDADIEERFITREGELDTIAVDIVKWVRVRLSEEN